ncbi:hypothetical protein I3842_Q139400 [Carya illinoinensis]|uniref:Uncharacterized protein n=1 Tax=Carya illinoinensis TaxID=32201 RepID=A0A922A027_CARIL|nr:hypothetical protein I3842_Q139400 [Carya illinoinensis]
MEAHLLTQQPCSLFTRPASPRRNPKLPVTPNLSSHSRRSCSTKYRPWDSNAEPVRSSWRFGFQDAEDEEDDKDQASEFGLGGSRTKKNSNRKRRWWNDDYSSSPEMEEESGGIFEEAIDSLWILKVFSSYGWALPFIIASLLLSTGPKAFLMALALPVGQSALSLVFDKLWGKTRNRPKRKSRMRRKPPASTASNVEREAEDQDESQDTRQGKVGYQSWVAGNNGPVYDGGREAPKFGGWDDLDRSRFTRRASHATSRSRNTPTERGKLSRRERKSDTPLLLRLLIAVFPFLGSWTKML